MPIPKACFAALALCLPLAFAQQPAPNEGFAQTMTRFIASCPERIAAAEARIDAAGVRDGGFYRVPGWPLLRSDRLIASFSPQGDNLGELATWLLQLRENDSIAREAELTNLGLDLGTRSELLTELRTCAVWLSDIALASHAPAGRAAGYPHPVSQRPAGRAGALGPHH